MSEEEIRGEKEKNFRIKENLLSGLHITSTDTRVYISASEGAMCLLQIARFLYVREEREEERLAVDTLEY